MSYNYSKFNFGYADLDHICFVTIKYYSKTDSGKSWKTKSDISTTESFSGLEYRNYIRSIPFFNTRVYSWEKTSCKARWNYTKFGYMPTVVTSISPTGDVKCVAIFDFTD